MVHSFWLIAIEFPLNLSCSLWMLDGVTIYSGVELMNLKLVQLLKCIHKSWLIQLKFLDEPVLEFAFISFKPLEIVITWLDHFLVNLVTCYMFMQRYILIIIVHSVNSTSLSVGIILGKLNMWCMLLMVEYNMHLNFMIEPYEWITLHWIVTIISFKC